MICLQIQLPFQKSIIIFCIYRPPSSDVSFFDRFETILESVSCSRSSISEIFVMGDINCDYWNSDRHSSDFSKLDFLMRSYNFSQIIDTPTRVTDRSETLIDTISPPILKLFFNMGVYKIQ